MQRQASSKHRRSSGVSGCVVASGYMLHVGFDLSAAARQEMIAEGFDPDFPAEAQQELAALAARAAPVPDNRLKDLRSLLWSSIDNDTSRDLEQIEGAERLAGGIRMMVGLADVDDEV